eukprot:682418_1
MIRLSHLSFILLVPKILSFAPVSTFARERTSLQVNRRGALLSVAFTVGAATPFTGLAFQQQLEDHLTEPTQLPNDCKLDLNSAFVGDYKKLRGMYPAAAG